MQIDKDAFVEFHYALVDKGEVQEGTRAGDPLTYVHGYMMLAPGLEAAMVGHQSGDHFQAEVPPETGFGMRDESLVELFPKQAFEDMPVVEKGLLVQLEDEEGKPKLARIVDIDQSGVTVDTNHPYAGVTLNFDVEIISVRTATTDELLEAEIKGRCE